MTQALLMLSRAAVVSRSSPWFTLELCCFDPVTVWVTFFHIRYIKILEQCSKHYFTVLSSPKSPQWTRAAVPLVRKFFTFTFVVTARNLGTTCLFGQWALSQGHDVNFKTPEHPEVELPEVFNHRTTSLTSKDKVLPTHNIFKPIKLKI